MKKIFLFAIALALLLLLVACNDSVNHDGEVKTPSGASVQKGKNYKDVISEFEKKGFINIKTETLEDLITGWLTKDGEVETVSVGGDENYSPDRWHPNNVEVIITYHTFPKNKEEVSMDSTSTSEVTEKDELELTFPIEKAKRAAVVAITNNLASDVFNEDGNTYDVSKFHSYADNSGNFFDYYITVDSWGTWSIKDDKTRYVDTLSYYNSLGTKFVSSLDVKYDGKNYIVTNITIAYKNGDIVEKGSDVFTISPEQIKKDRDLKKLDSYPDWLNSQFSAWDGSHKELNKLIKKNLNDEKSFKHIETTYQVISTKDIKDDVNATLKSGNESARVDFGDIWITTHFSAKNAFNATVKNTAYGIESFSNDTISLIAIE